MSLRGGRADAVGLTLLVVLGGLVGLAFALPFAGLLGRAASDGGVWDLATSTPVREALVLSLWTATLATANRRAR